MDMQGQVYSRMVLVDHQLSCVRRLRKGSKETTRQSSLTIERNTTISYAMRYNKGAGHLQHKPYSVIPKTYFLNCLRLCKTKVYFSILIHLVLQVVILRYYGPFLI